MYDRGPGPLSMLSGHWKLWCLDAFSCYLSLILRHSDTKRLKITVLSKKKIELIFTLFVTDVTPWVVTSVITCFGVNIE